MFKPIQRLCQRLVAHRYFELSIVTLIFLNAFILGLETVESIRTEYQLVLDVINQGILVVFVFEVIVKLISVWPSLGQYFKNGWNVFDFTIVVLSLVPFSSEYAMIGRLLRLLRVLRLVSALPQLRLIVETLLRSIPAMGHVMLLLSLLFYIYAITGYHLYHEALPEQWGSLGRSLMTLFIISTLEGWGEELALCAKVHPMSWIFFVSFIVLATFVIINLFIAIVLDNMEKAKTETLKMMKTDQSELLLEIDLIEKQLKQLRRRLQDQ